MTRSLRLLIISLLLTTPIGADAVEFETARLCLITKSKRIPMSVEVARSAPQREQGLMNRTRLADDAGMLFLFPAPQSAASAFWMYRTRIPLDIAFLGPAGDIRTIRTMPPCLHDEPGQCPTYAAGAEYVAALEVNRGFFAKKRIAVGDRVLPAENGRCSPG